MTKCVPVRVGNRGQASLKQAKQVLQHQHQKNQRTIKRKKSLAIYKSAQQKTATTPPLKYTTNTEEIPFPFTWTYKSDQQYEQLTTKVKTGYQYISFTVQADAISAFTAECKNGDGLVYYLGNQDTGLQNNINGLYNLRDGVGTVNTLSSRPNVASEAMQSAQFSFSTNTDIATIFYAPNKTYQVAGNAVKYLFSVTKTNNEITFTVYSDKRALLSYPTASYGFIYSVSPESLRIGAKRPLLNSGNSSYDVDPDKPYGLVFKKTRPPGYPIDAPKVSTREAGVAFITQKIAELPTRLASIPSLASFIPWLSEPKNLEEFTKVLLAVSYNEANNQLYLAKNNFDIRNPVPPGTADSLNLIDEGPFPRTYKLGKKGIVSINSAKRPKGKAYASDCGCFQYTATTFRGLLSRWNEYLDSGVPDNVIPSTFVWDTPPHVQVLLQIFEMILKVYLPTTQVGVPASYRAIFIYLHNAMPTPTNTLISRMSQALNAQPNLDERGKHLLCKRLYDIDTWWNVPGLSPDKYSQRKRFANNCSYGMVISRRSVARSYPHLFETNPALLPNTPNRITK